MNHNENQPHNITTSSGPRNIVFDHGHRPSVMQRLGPRPGNTLPFSQNSAHAPPGNTCNRNESRKENSTPIQSAPDKKPELMKSEGNNTSTPLGNTSSNKADLTANSMNDKCPERSSVNASHASWKRRGSASPCQENNNKQFRRDQNPNVQYERHWRNEQKHWKRRPNYYQNNRWNNYNSNYRSRWDNHSCERHFQSNSTMSEVAAAKTSEESHGGPRGETCVTVPQLKIPSNLLNQSTESKSLKITKSESHLGHSRSPSSSRRSASETAVISSRSASSKSATDRPSLDCRISMSITKPSVQCNPAQHHHVRHKSPERHSSNSAMRSTVMPNPPSFYISGVQSQSGVAPRYFRTSQKVVVRHASNSAMESPMMPNPSSHASGLRTQSAVAPTHSAFLPSMDASFNFTRVRKHLCGNFADDSVRTVCNMRTVAEPKIKATLIGGIIVNSVPDMYQLKYKLPDSNNWKRAIGLSPDILFKFETSKIDILSHVKSVYPRSAALGPIGIDRTAPAISYYLQDEVLIELMKISSPRKPLILKIQGPRGDDFGLDAHARAFHLAKGNLQTNQLIHLTDYSANTSTVRQWLGTFKNTHFGFSSSVMKFNDNQKSAVSAVPEDRILFESDTPHEDTKKENVLTPIYLADIASKVAEIRGIHIEQILNASVKNTRSLYGFPS